MNDFYSIVIDKESDTPIYQQLGDALCRLIEKGILEANSKLPPIREMANKLKVNNVTVVTAYKYLENKKVVYSQVGSGTYVSPIPLNDVPKPVVEENLIRLEKKDYDIQNAINFVSTALPEELFPVDEFKAAFNEVLERERGMAFSYQESRGYLPLRESACEYLKYYNIKTTPEQIQIISGAQQGIDIAAKALINYGDVIFVEKPTFYGAAGAFLSRGGKLVEIEMEHDGMDMDKLENLMKLYHPKLLYVMTYFQTPTGISYSIDKKRRLLELAEKYDCYIIEDDNLFDFNYTGKPIVSLKSLDYKNRVIYVKSFSKILMPGLRIGIIVLPKKVMHKVMTAKYTTDLSTSGFIQKAFDLYLREDTWKEHIEVMRKYGMAKYKITMKAIDRYLKDCTQYRKPQGGISIWLSLEEGTDAEKLCNILLNKGVIVSPGSQFFISGEKSRHIRVCFANVREDRIEQGIRRIREGILFLRDIKKSEKIHESM